MWRRQASLAVPLLLVTMAAAAVATRKRSACVAFNQEVLDAITTNQMALLRETNESSVCASREGELREIRLLKLEAIKYMEGMKEAVKNEFLRLKEEVTQRLEAKEREVTEVLNAIRNTPFQPAETTDPPIDFEVLHNDTNPSLCGPLKVLYGSRGALSPSHPNAYRNSMNCEWRVTLPEGTRPVFTWEYIEMESCFDCGCDAVKVSAPGVGELPWICGSTIPVEHPMDNITSNEFTVVFKSDTFRNRRGFILYYSAELVA